MKTSKIISLLALAAALTGSGFAANPVSVTLQPFGKMPDGKEADIYSLKNQSGATVDITNYGGTVVRVLVPDRHGDLGDVVLGFNDLPDYLKCTTYFGALIGRFGNRIAGGKFTLDGHTYTLPINDTPGGMPCSLHGGNGFDKRLWKATPLIVGGQPALRLHLVSPDGDQGYPGTLKLTVTYTLTKDNALRIEYAATTDKATPINFTNHTYFNLRGEGDGDILGEIVTIKASHFTPVNAGLIPTGEIAPVAGTPFDFTTPHAIGERINADNQQIKYGPGYDDNWVLDNQSGKLELAATVYEPDSGRTLEVFTTEPGLQFYTGNFLDGTLKGKSGRPYIYRSGFTMETQHYPDSPNHPNFPSTILRPGQTFHSTTIFKFGTR
jgi:aldose 1-epimerase